MSVLSREEVLGLLGGSPAQIVDELTAFAESERVLSSDHPRLITVYPEKWVGVFKGEVVASDGDKEALSAKLVAQGVPVAQTIVRFIDRSEKTFIL